jgi:uncharacterized protein
MKNPFMYGKPVTGDNFLPLPELEKTLSNYVESNISVVIIGPRRFGKTSFLKNFLIKKRLEGFTVVDVDAFNTISHRDFLRQLINAISREKSLSEKLGDFFKSIKELTPHLRVETSPHSGEINYSLSLKKVDFENVKQTILEILDGLPRLGKKVIISIDEFQKIGELRDGGWLEATLRTKMQEHPKLSFIFTGSRRSLLEDMFNNSKRPFYRSCTVIQFPSFGPEFSAWIMERFKTAKVKCSLSAIDYLRSKVDETPHYVQEVCFHLISQGFENITPLEIDEVLEIISTQSSYSYEALLNTLSPAQIRLLRMLVFENEVNYSKESLERYEFKLGSNIQAAIKSLVEKQILEKEPSENQLRFDDPMFKIWLHKKMA